MKTIRIELTPEQTEELKDFHSIYSWTYDHEGVLEVTYRDRDCCDRCGQKLPPEGKNANG